MNEEQIGFLLSNFEMKGLMKFGNLYHNNCFVHTDACTLKVRISANWRTFHQYADFLDNQPAKRRIKTDDFYFALDHDKGSASLILQTDIVAYEPCFFFRKGCRFALSNNIILLVDRLKRSGIDVDFDERKVREYLVFSESFFQDTIFKNIEKIPPAAIVKITVASGEYEIHCYDDFRMKGDYTTAEEAAAHADRALDEYFKTHKSENLTFTIGMSGGLDSRVGAYYAVKNGYRIRPIFIGIERNRFGVFTNDAVCARRVNNELKCTNITFYNPKNMSIAEKLHNDALFAPGMVDNIPQNLGVIPKTDVLLHAMMGGEAFGQLVKTSLPNESNEALAEYLIFCISCIPKSKISVSLLRYCSMILPQNLKKIFSNDESLACEVLSEDDIQSLKERVMSWIEEQKEHGLDNINIWHKWFYYRFAPIARNGYYSTFNARVPSVATYMNPCFIAEMLCWKSDFLLEKKVQKALLLRLGNLSKLRSQTTACTIAEEQSPLKKAVVAFNTLERFLRGGAMVYTDWYKPKEILDLLAQYEKNSNLWPRIRFDVQRWIGSDFHMPLTLLKLLYLEEYLE